MGKAGAVEFWSFSGPASPRPLQHPAHWTETARPARRPRAVCFSSQLLRSMLLRCEESLVVSWNLKSFWMWTQLFKSTVRHRKTAHKPLAWMEHLRCEKHEVRRCFLLWFERSVLSHSHCFCCTFSPLVQLVWRTSFWVCWSVCFVSPASAFPFN